MSRRQRGVGGKTARPLLGLQTSAAMLLKSVPPAPVSRLSLGGLERGVPPHRQQPLLPPGSGNG